MEAGFDPLLALGWSVLAGFMMSMGAGGGIFAGIGHLSVLGMTDANTIKVSNQILEFASRLVAVPLYHRQNRLIGSLAIAYGVGAPPGAVCGSWFSRYYLQDLATYRTWFGVLVALIGLSLLREAWGRRGTGATHARSDAAARTARAPRAEEAARTLAWGWRRCRVRFGGETFEFDPVVAAGGGFVIAFVGATLGVAGGFLAAPFMALVLLFPMYLVIGTALIALMVPLVISILTYLALEVKMNWWLMAVEVPGVLAGSFLGPLVSRHMNERLLKSFVAAALVAIGSYYVALAR